MANANTSKYGLSWFQKSLATKDEEEFGGSIFIWNVFPCFILFSSTPGHHRKKAQGTDFSTNDGGSEQGISKLLQPASPRWPDTGTSAWHPIFFLLRSLLALNLPIILLRCNGFQFSPSLFPSFLWKVMVTSKQSVDHANTPSHPTPVSLNPIS